MKWQSILSFGIGFFLLSIISWRFIQVVKCINSSFLSVIVIWVWTKAWSYVPTITLSNLIVSLSPKSSVLHLFIPPQPLANTDISTVSTVLSLPECHTVGFIECVDFSCWLLHLALYIQCSSMSFYGLIAHLFLLPNNIPLHGCTTVFLFAYWEISWLLLAFGNYE